MTWLNCQGMEYLNDREDELRRRSESFYQDLPARDAVRDVDSLSELSLFPRSTTSIDSTEATTIDDQNTLRGSRSVLSEDLSHSATPPVTILDAPIQDFPIQNLDVLHLHGLEALYHGHVASVPHSGYSLSENFMTGASLRRTTTSDNLSEDWVSLHSANLDHQEENTPPSGLARLRRSFSKSLDMLPTRFNRSTSPVLPPKPARSQAPFIKSRRRLSRFFVHHQSNHARRPADLRPTASSPSLGLLPVGISPSFGTWAAEAISTFGNERSGR